MKKEKHELVDAVIEQLKKDFENDDYTVLEELLYHLPNERLIFGLPEEDWVKFK